MRPHDLVLSQFPGRLYISLVEAGIAIGYKKQSCYNLHHRGRFPIRVRMHGRMPMVALTDLISYMEEKPAPQPGKRRTGRPMNADRQTS